MRLAVIGGTGKQGRALAERFARAGIGVVIGSREADRAVRAAAELNALIGNGSAQGFHNRDAAGRADVVLLAVPYEGLPPILSDIRDAVQNKIVVNTASSLDPERKSRAKVPAAGSITAEVQQVLGDAVRVVAAFQNIAPERLLSWHEPIDCDVLVCGADRAARDQIIGLIRQTGIHALDAGSLANAVAVETLTAVLIAINSRYKVSGSGIRITGLKASE